MFLIKVVPLEEPSVAHSWVWEVPSAAEKYTLLANFVNRVGWADPVGLMSLIRETFGADAKVGLSVKDRIMVANTMEICSRRLADTFINFTFHSFLVWSDYAHPAITPHRSKKISIFLKEFVCLLLSQGSKDG